MQRIDQLGGGREPFCRGNILWCWTHCRQLAPLGTAAPCLRPRLCIDLHDATCADELPSAQNVYNELKPVVGFIVAGELATTVKVGQELRGARVGG
jgi:4-hydroxy-tetrahydrodipicolinate synthase